MGSRIGFPDAGAFYEGEGALLTMYSKARMFINNTANVPCHFLSDICTCLYSVADDILLYHQHMYCFHEVVCMPNRHKEALCQGGFRRAS
jgi:hypothetical protein